MKGLRQLGFVAIATLFVGAVAVLLVVAVGSDVSRAFSGFFKGVFGSLHALSEVLVRATPLMLASLGVSVGFRTGFVNIGAEGQLYAGAVAATAVALAFPSLPALLMVCLMMVAGAAAGGVWSIVPGVLKARFGISEVINTIMLNYIAINGVGVLVRTVFKDPAYPYPMSPMLPATAVFPALVQPLRVHAGLFVALFCVAGVYVLLFHSSTGFCMRAVGLNQRCCRCCGIPVMRSLLLGSCLGGMLAGLAGVAEIAGVHHRLMEGISPGYGYIAIVVALLGNNHPVGILMSSIAIAALQVGSLAMQRTASVPSSISSIIMGLLVLVMLVGRNRISRSIETGTRG